MVKNGIYQKSIMEVIATDYHIAGSESFHVHEIKISLENLTDIKVT